MASATTCTAAMVGLTILVGAMGTADGREIVNAMLSGGFIGLLLSLLLPGKHRPSETAAASGHPDDNRPASASENQSG
ncbi:hypothetical protein [Neisseria sp.]|uniref:hypothetical protein n=1 Tax=Neisseria sp. TaxID=192066 RepID=UPI00359FA494